MPYKILIVEDEALIATEIRQTLELLGYEVVAHAMNGDDALDLLASRAIDLALLDINIKGTKSGIDLAKVIRRKYKIPFVFLTSFSDKATLEEVKTTMPYGYIVKPFNDDDLRSNIELALYKFQQEFKFPSIHQIDQKHRVNLTEREHEILSNICEGKKYQKIANDLFLSINTVKTYQKRLYQYFNVKSKYELMQKFYSVPIL